MKSKWFLAFAAAILGLALFSSLSVPVEAATPSIKLVLGGTGSIPWAIGPVAPGDNGTQSVTLSNTGFSDGVVTIWISAIVNGEGVNLQSETGDTAEPGELGEYLMLNVSGTNLSKDFVLPAKLSNFPQSEIDTKHIFVNPLKAFSTLTLQWEWHLPLITGDDIQGDTLSFTINYMLEEVPPLPSPSPSPLPTGGEVAPQSNTSIDITTTETNPSDMVIGSTESYTLSATNTGATVLHDVVVTVNLPEFLNYQSSIPEGTATGSQIVWNLGILNIGEAKEIVVILGGVKAGTAVITVTMTTREGVTSTYSLSVMVSGAPVVPAPSLILPATPLPPQVTPTENETVTIVTVTSVLSVPPEKQNGMSIWLIPAILAVIGAAALVYYIVIVLMRRRRWDWIPYALIAGGVSFMVRTAEQRTLYTARHQKRVAELADAITREMKMSKKLADTDIFLKTQILAVAGVVETMANTVKTVYSNKNYRPAMNLDKILEEINKASVYDSEVVQAFVRLVDRGKFAFQTHYD